MIGQLMMYWKQESSLRTLKEPLVFFVYYDRVHQTLMVTDLSYKSTAHSHSRTVFKTQHHETNRQTQAQKPASHYFSIRLRSSGVRQTHTRSREDQKVLSI